MAAELHRSRRPFRPVPSWTFRALVRRALADCTTRCRPAKVKAGACAADRAQTTGLLLYLDKHIRGGATRGDAISFSGSLAPQRHSIDESTRVLLRFVCVGIGNSFAPHDFSTICQGLSSLLPVDLEGSGDVSSRDWVRRLETKYKARRAICLPRRVELGRTERSAPLRSSPRSGQEHLWLAHSACVKGRLTLLPRAY